MDGRKADRRRARPEARIGRTRASAVATRLGVALRDARHRSGLTQAEVGDAAGVSQTLVSGIERGHGAATSVETLARLAAAVGEQFVAFLEQAPGSDRPRDIEHVRRQSALIALAANGGWSAL
ncbi:MAG TPA: helix-turn-helix transcriptional regulator, partial [Patescibacteria group bacterium]|nr:helix-turn-helix transcriptional regulator [Patescibacteria group bacterium]